ncbi:hypothetical protein EDD18DRAFT_1143102 [Armillaria luteobubalina]|uniref:Uncharacterized protein n=1 Tax=Armillaria luteobubalina TaxID=153913 RepID=A0AA39UX67_9AGAR|nr:hypothetical protein EDD18DRAFT_1143102 [Armillaria luteobubalina]
MRTLYTPVPLAPGQGINYQNNSQDQFNQATSLHRKNSGFLVFSVVAPQNLRAQTLNTHLFIELLVMIAMWVVVSFRIAAAFLPGSILDACPVRYILDPRFFFRSFPLALRGRLGDFESGACIACRFGHVPRFPWQYLHVRSFCPFSLASTQRRRTSISIPKVERVVASHHLSVI